MKSKLIATLIAGGMLASGTLFAQPRFAVGVSFGAPIAPAPIAYAATPCPGPGYVWVDGSYGFVGGRRIWNAGFWRAPVVVNRPIVVERGFNRGFVRDEHRAVVRNDRRDDRRNDFRGHR